MTTNWHTESGCASPTHAKPSCNEIALVLKKPLEQLLVLCTTGGLPGEEGMLLGQGVRGGLKSGVEETDDGEE